MTKTQIKAKLRKLLERLGDIKAEVEDVAVELEDERDSIEPYENRDELTEAQEAKYEWLDEVVYDLQNLADSMDENINEIDYKMDE